MHHIIIKNVIKKGVLEPKIHQNPCFFGAGGEWSESLSSQLPLHRKLNPIIFTIFIHLPPIDRTPVTHGKPPVECASGKLPSQVSASKGVTWGPRTVTCWLGKGKASPWSLCFCFERWKVYLINSCVVVILVIWEGRKRIRMGSKKGWYGGIVKSKNLRSSSKFPKHQSSRATW